LAEEGVGEGDVAGRDKKCAADCLTDWIYVRVVGWKGEMEGN